MNGDLSPPDNYTEEQRDAYRLGMKVAAQRMGMHARYLAGVGSDENPTDDDSDDDSDDEPENPCPECGAELIDAFGGEACTTCGYES